MPTLRPNGASGTEENSEKGISMADAHGAIVFGNRCDSIDAVHANLERENAKLRELVRIMAYCMQYERECDGCALNGGSDAITEHAGCDGLRELMRELGVDDG